MSKKQFKKYCKECGKRLVKDGVGSLGFNEDTGKRMSVQYWSCPKEIQWRLEEEKELQAIKEGYGFSREMRAYKEAMAEYDTLSWFQKLFIDAPHFPAFLYPSQGTIKFRRFGGSGHTNKLSQLK